MTEHRPGFSRELDDLLSLITGDLQRIDVSPAVGAAYNFISNQYILFDRDNTGFVRSFDPATMSIELVYSDLTLRSIRFEKRHADMPALAAGIIDDLIVQEAIARIRRRTRAGRESELAAQYAACLQRLPAIDQAKRGNTPAALEDGAL